MPESSGDQPKPPPPTPPEPPANNLTVVPRANPPSVFNQKSAPPASTPPGAAELMEWMKTFAGGSPPAEEAAPGGRILIPREQKKFSRQTAESGRPAPDAAGTPPAAGTGLEGDIPSKTPRGGAEIDPANAPLRPVPPEPITAGRRRRSKEQAPRVPASVLVAASALLALIVGSFFLGRATASRQSMPPRSASDGPASAQAANPPPVLPAALAAKVDQANAAERRGDFVRARSLLEEVQQAGGHPLGLDYHLALLAVAADDGPKALTLLNDSIARGDNVADAYNLRGIMMERAAGLGKGLPDLQRAAQLDPFNARHAYFVGEVLRRMGKPQAAQDYLRQALHRLNEPALEAGYESKLRLAQLESGQEQQFADELASKLALVPPPLDWLFTAAAVELRHGNVTAAANYLDKAREEAGWDEVNARLRDYYFASFADDKELARFFHPPAKTAVTPPTAPPSAPLPTTAPLPPNAAGGLPKLP